MQHKERAEFKVLQYKLPPGSPEAYAARAVAILRKIERLDVRLLPYFMASDVILTLSGVRALDTYLTFEGLSSHAVRNVTKLLAAEGLSLFPHVSEYDDSDAATYSLIHHKALAVLPHQYDFGLWINPKPPFTFDRLLAWTYVMEYKLQEAMERDELPRKWLRDRFAAHNVRFGILLGYPGEAIAAYCWREAYSDRHVPMMQASIEYHDAYDAAVPAYEFAAILQTDPAVHEHQLIWSDILGIAYESNWHRGLIQMPAFGAAINQFKLARL